ncbi:MAG TPA: hypothetical protein VIS72_09585, partial [Anaerolineales bacterium]
RFGFEFTLADQGFEILSIYWTELYVLFVHLAIFYQMPTFVKNLLYDVVSRLKRWQVNRLKDLFTCLF